MSFPVQGLCSRPTAESSCHDLCHDPCHDRSRIDPYWWLHAPIVDPFHRVKVQLFVARFFGKCFTSVASRVLGSTCRKFKKKKEGNKNQRHFCRRATMLQKIDWPTYPKWSRFTTLLRLNTSARSTSALFNCRSKPLLWGIFSAMVSTAEAAAAFSTKQTWLLLRSTCWPSDRVNWNDEGGIWQETVAKMPSNFSLPGRFDNLNDENG